MKVIRTHTHTDTHEPFFFPFCRVEVLFMECNLSVYIFLETTSTCTAHEALANICRPSLLSSNHIFIPFLALLWITYMR